MLMIDVLVMRGAGGRYERCFDPDFRVGGGQTGDEADMEDSAVLDDAFRCQWPCLPVKDSPLTRSDAMAKQLTDLNLPILECQYDAPVVT